MLNNYFLIKISTVLVNNIVLNKILSLCPFMGVSKKLDTSISMSAATAFVLTIGSMTSWYRGMMFSGILNLFAHAGYINFSWTAFNITSLRKRAR